MSKRREVWVTEARVRPQGWWMPDSTFCFNDLATDRAWRLESKGVPARVVRYVPAPKKKRKRKGGRS
jgi:hypothetical protein